MINSFSSRFKSFVSGNKTDETSVTFHRKRKREVDERYSFDGEVEFVSEKKPKLERTASHSSRFSSVFSTRTLQNMSDWVQHKIPHFSMFGWRSKPSKALTHGNGQGVHGHQGYDLRLNRTATAPVTNPSQSYHRDALKTAYGNMGSLPPGLNHRTVVNGEELEQSLVRPPLHGSSFMPQSKHAESDAESSVTASSQGSRKGLSRLSEKIFRTKQKFTAAESVRLDDKVRYKELLQQFTTVPLEQETVVQRPVQPQPIKHPVPQLPRFYFKSNDSILGSTTNKSLIVPEKQKISERPRIKVHPSQRRTPQRLSAQPSVNGSHVEDDSLIHITDISAINDSRANNLPGSSQRVSIDLTEDDDDDVQVISKQRPSITDYRESKFMSEDWIKDLKTQYSSKARERERQIAEEEIKARLYDERRKAQDEDLENRIRRQMQIYKKEPAVAEELFVEEEEEEREEELPELTDEMEAKISQWLCPQPGGQVLVEKFRLQITRKDVATLAGLNWLNDEIINFYMNLLMERGERENKPKVYAFNTFFYPKITSGGQAAVKRWTRRVDVFAQDYILVPVHLGMHWCLAVVDFKKKQIQYYDSMGGNNVQCLNVIKTYLCDESLDKKKQEFNMQGWSTQVVKNIPQQMNGSDCGMFACKYADYITREVPITFTQQHMPYFRRRMVYEIVTGKLLQ